MFIYVLDSATMTASSFFTNGTPNTESHHATIKPGARTLFLTQLVVGGKAGALTALSGIAYRLKKRTTSATTVLTPATPTPSDPGAQACKASGGIADPFNLGTGGPLYLGGCLIGAGGPGGWKARDISMAPGLEGLANQSIDLATASPVANLGHEFKLSFSE